MGLNNRQVQILRKLSRASGRLALAAIAQSEQVSERTIYYDINAINKFLICNHAGSVSILSRQVLCQDVDWDMVARLSSRVDAVYFTADERRTMMLLRIALVDEKVSIKTMMSIFEISRNTVIADIRDIKERVRRFGIVLTSTQASGYTLEGEERSIRELLWNDLQTLRNREGLMAARSLLQDALVQKTQEEIDFFELCRCLVKQYERDLDTQCFLEETGLELMMIQVSWLRSLDGHIIEMGNEERSALMGTLSYRSIQCSALKLRQNGLPLSQEEMLYITSLLLGIKTANFAGQRDEDAYVSRLAEQLASNFERVSCLNYVDRPLVCEQMSNHIRPLYYRLKYGVQAGNPLTGDIKKIYPMTFEFTRRAAQETGLLGLSDGELGYLTIYLTAGLDRKMLEEGDTSSEKVLIIGADNNATITLMKRQITDALGIGFDYSFAELKKVRRWQLDRYALVIALVPISEQMKSGNMVEASPFLKEADFKRIVEILRGNRIISRYSGMIAEVLDIFRHSLPNYDRDMFDSDKLFFELFRFFSKRNYGYTERVPAATDRGQIISDVLVVAKQFTWQETVMTGCRAIAERTGSQLLLSRMENLIQSPKFQWYRMADDAVLVHCPMQGDEYGCVTTQAVVNREGIVFPDQRLASTVICLTTVDRYSHWSALYTLYKSFGSVDSTREFFEGMDGERHVG